MKNCVAARNTTFKITDVQDLARQKLIPLRVKRGPQFVDM
jgi:hypothetical protein